MPEADNPNAEPFARLGHLDVCVLMSVAILGPDVASGTTVRNHLAGIAELPRTHGAIQAGMRRMEGHGWLETRLGPPRAVRGGRSHILYRVTPTGMRVLKDYLAGMDALREGTEFAYPMHRPQRINQNP